MLCGGKSHPVPLVRGDTEYKGIAGWDDGIALFDSEYAAEAAGNANPMGLARGFEVYGWPWSEPEEAATA